MINALWGKKRTEARTVSVRVASASSGAAAVAIAPAAGMAPAVGMSAAVAMAPAATATPFMMTGSSSTLERPSYQPNVSVRAHRSAGLVPAVSKMGVADLDLYYKDFKALKNIDLEFPENQVTALIGPSGCGKSTLLKSLNRMNDLVEGCRIEGSITLDGQDIRRDVEVNALRRRVGMVFQQPNPFPMSVYDNVAFGPRTHGIKKREDLDAIVEQSLRDAAIWDELKDRLKKNALGLSGGQQQRLCIARALAVRPEVLLMDEATSALDPISTAKIEELVAQLKERYTIIMVTHNMLQALRVSDKTAFFLLGEMVESGETDDIFTSPQDPRTADYVAGRFG
ncbi:MAG: phosphate ABC transporter ATP-binding protein PstB [Gordonibacter sp.]